MKKFLFFLIAGLGLTMLLSSCQPDVVPTSVTVNPTSMTLKVGEEATIQVTILPEKATQVAAWESSNSKIVYAGITQNPTTGKVKALAPGTATVKCLVPDAPNYPTCVVTVIE